MTFPRMHVSLYVRNLTATVNFYTAFFGQEPTKQRPGYAKYTLAEPSLIISFVENPDRVQAHFGHLGFQVETLAQLAERRTLAEAAGLISREEIGTACCYAKQDKFWATDPDGVQWEVYYFHEDAEFNDPHYQAEYNAADATANPSANATAQCCIAPARQTELVMFADTPAETVAAPEAGCGCGVPATRTLEPACC